MPTTVNYAAALENAWAAGLAARDQPERISGCGRVYVCVYGRHARGLKAAAKKLGRLWTAFGLYVGYDNADGRALAQGTAVVAALQAAGVDTCYRDERED